MSKCPMKRCAISVIALGVFFYAYEYIVNVHVLMDMYNQTPQLWRTEAEMGQYAPWFLVRYLLLAMAVTCIYKKLCRCEAPCGNASSQETGKKPCPYQKSICFGASLGVLMGTLAASSYIWMPISGTLALAWFATYIVEGIGAGLVLACVWKKKDCSVS